MLLLALTLLGCSAPPAEELVYLSFSEIDAFEVDTLCEPPCVPPLTVQVTFEDNLLVDPASQVHLDEYIVAYDLDQVELTPFHGVMDLSLGPDETSFANVDPASPQQQGEAYAALGTARAVGTATLTAAGTDWRDRSFSIWGEFSIAFQELPDTFPGEDGGDDTGAR